MPIPVDLTGIDRAAGCPEPPSVIQYRVPREMCRAKEEGFDHANPVISFLVHRPQSALLAAGLGRLGIPFGRHRPDASGAAEHYIASLPTIYQTHSSRARDLDEDLIISHCTTMLEPEGSRGPRPAQLCSYPK